jgi:Uma2 family endonuclease
MTAQRIASELVSVEDYLAGEVLSETRHEYVGGFIYAMAGASEAHNRIQMNLYRELAARLRGRRCEPFGSDMRLRLEMQGDPFFYYPDAMVACDPADVGHPWRERPTVIFEIITEDRRSIDEREKRIAYKQISGLAAYVRIEQDRAEVVVEQRIDGEWQTQHLTGLEAVLRLPSIEVELPLGDLYERVALA